MEDPSSLDQGSNLGPLQGNHRTTRRLLQRALHATLLLQKADSGICFCQPKEIQTSFSILKKQKVRIWFSICLAAGKVHSPGRKSAPPMLPPQGQPLASEHPDVRASLLGPELFCAPVRQTHPKVIPSSLGSISDWHQRRLLLA